MAEKHSFGLKQIGRIPNFFKDNLGKHVNLYGTTPPTTYSGVLAHYDHARQVVVLNPYLGVRYTSDGKISHEVVSRNFEIPLEIVGAREISTREDFLSRLANYNLDNSKQKPNQ
jgi:hypothetical protein